MTFGVILLWAYVSLEANMYFTYRRSLKKCETRLRTASSPPPDVSDNVMKQLQVMPRIRTFYRDLFGASDHTEIKYGNIENLFVHTIGATSQAVVKYMIKLAEKQLNHKFEKGYNNALQHTYCKEDDVVRGRYIPALLTSSLISLKFVCDWYIGRQFNRVNKEHAVYWIFDKGMLSKAKRVLIFMCGIGIGPITYLNLVSQFKDIYDVIIMVEIKWISFHIRADPVADSVLIEDIGLFVTEYLHNQKLGCYCLNPDKCDSFAFQDSSLQNQSEQCNNYAHKVASIPCDVMMHSGGALYFRRLIEKIRFSNKILIEPACFLDGSSTATLQLYSYKSRNPLFQYPLIKNLPKLLDIAECVLQTDTPMDSAFLILSQQDKLFNPVPCAHFMERFHPSVEIFFVENSGHGDAVALHHLMTAAIIKKKIGC
jgi:hypothetical protein